MQWLAGACAVEDLLCTHHDTFFSFVCTLQETVDELRAEMALTRAAVQSYRNKLQQYNPQ